MKVVIAALLLLSQGTREVRLPITATSGFRGLVISLVNVSGLKIDDSAIKSDYESIRMAFEDEDLRLGHLTAPNYELLLEKLVLRTEPRVAVERKANVYFLKLVGQEVVAAEVRVTLAPDISVRDAIAVFKSRFAAKGMVLDDKGIDWVRYHTPSMVPENRANRVDGPIEAETLEQALLQLLERTNPRVRPRVTGNTITLEHKFPFVTLETVDASGQSKTVKAILEEINRQLPGYSLKDQTYRPGLVVGRQFSVSELPLDAALDALAKACVPSLEVADLDPDLKTGRLVLATTGGRPLIVPQVGHRGGVVAVEADPTGKRVITEGSEGTINIWDVAKRQTAKSYVGKVARNAFSPDGSFAIVANGGVISRLDFATRQAKWLRMLGGRVTSLAYSPRKRLVAAVDATGTLFVFDEQNPYLGLADPATARGYRFFTIGQLPGPNKRVALSKDGDYLAFSSGNSVVVWDLRNQEAGKLNMSRVIAEPFKRISDLPGDVTQMEFGDSGRGARLAIACAPGVLALYGQTFDPLPLSAANAAPQHYLVQNPDQNNARDVRVRFSSDGTRIAVMGSEDRLTVHDASTGAVVQTVQRAGQGNWPFGDVDVLPDGGIVAGLNVTANVVVDDKVAVYRGTTKESFSGSTTPIRNVWLSTDGRSLVVDEEGFGFRLWDLSMRTPPRFFPASLVSVQPFNHRDANESARGIMLLGIADEVPPRGYGTPNTTQRQSRRPVLKRWIITPNAVSEYAYPLEWFDGASSVQQIIWSGDGSKFALLEQRRVRIASPHTPPTPPIDLPANVISFQFNARGTAFVAYCQDQSRGYLVKYDVDKQAFEGSAIQIPGTGGDRIVAADRINNVMAFSHTGNTYLEVPGVRAELKVRGVNPSLNNDGRYLAVQDGDRCVLYDLSSVPRGGQPVEARVSLRGQFSPTLAPSGEQMLTRSADRTKAYYYNFRKSRGPSELFQHRAPIASVAFAPAQSLTAVGSDDGTVWIYGPKVTSDGYSQISWPTTGNPLVQLRGLGPEDFVVTDVMNQYWASKSAAKQISFTTESGELYRYDQYDAVLNRPHEIMRTMGLATAEDVSRLKRATELRWQYLGFKLPMPDPKDLNFATPMTPESSEAPKTTTSPSVTLEFTLRDNYAQLDRWNVVVNGVPEKLTDARIVQSPNERGEPVKRKAEVALNRGRNLIQVWTTNIRGIDSTKLELEVEYQPATPRKPVLYALLIGVSEYGPMATNLHAESRKLPGAKVDQARLSAFLRRLDPAAPDAFGNSPFSKVVVEAPPNPTLGQIREARERLLRSANPDDLVILAFSGHGLIEDRDDNMFRFLPSNYDHAGMANALRYDEIEQMVMGCGSRNLLILLDACQSGEVDRSEGAMQARRDLYRKDPEVSTVVLARGEARAHMVSEELALMRQNFVDLELRSGAVVISATSGGESAFETKGGGGGILTTAVLESLGAFGPGFQSRVDKNQDGVIRVSELRDYLVWRVPQGHSGQIPTMRQENPDNDFALFPYPKPKPPAKPVKPAPKKAPAKKTTTKRSGGG